MSQSLVFILLMLALVLPVMGAIVMRILAPRLSSPQFYGGAALIFAVAVISVLVLARSNISSLQIGGLSLLLPVAGPDESSPRLPPLPIESPSPEITATLALPATTPTEAPTAEPPTAAPPPAPSQRTYTVQPGDTLRSIAEQFNVSVQALIDANNLTPEQADSLRIGQVLVIP